MNTEENAANLLNLPHELLLSIFAFVEWKDLCRVGCVCKQLKYLSQSNALWKRLCHIYWLDVVPQDPSTSWYETFIKCYQKWGQFIGCYSTVKELWNQIETALEKRGATEVLESLHGPVVTDGERRLDSTLIEPLDIPLDLLCSYHIHDGQKLEPALRCATTGLGGLLNVYDYDYCPEFLKYDEMLAGKCKITERKAVEGDLDTLSFLACSTSDATLRICLNSAGDFKRGNIVHCPQAFIQQTVFRGKDVRGFFLCAESFTDWLRQLADKLCDPGTVVNKSSFLRVDHNPDCVAVTRHVKVSVATTFIPEVQHNQERNLFAYHITMEMDKDAPTSSSCQLLTRHWIITDASGRVERVDGDGVIGAFPIIKPGTVYSWSSITTFTTMTGSMGGHFGMVNLQTGEEFNVKCPDFHMEALPYLLLPEKTGAGDT